mgnify:CR=1 FL=1
MSAAFYSLTPEMAAAMARSYHWECGWRERFGAWLILMAQKVVGFDSEATFERARQAILTVERSGVDKQPHRGRWGGEAFGRVLIGKSNSAITKGTGSANNVSVWDGVQGSESDTGDDVTAWNYFGDIADAKWVAFVETVRGYVILAAEC